MRRMSMLLWACSVVIGALAQDAPAADTVDRTDPRAVVQAYVDACQRGDVEAALALTAGDDSLRASLREISGERGQMRARIGLDFEAMLTEIGLTPIGSKREAEVVDTRTDGDTVTVTTRETVPRETRFVLVKDAEGKWSIDFEATAKATTGAEKSYLVWQAEMRAQALAQAGAQGGGPRSPDYWQRRNALQMLAGRLTAMAEANGKFPAAETWTDDVIAYHLDSAVVEPPEEWGGKYGFALNAGIAGQPLPDDWHQRQSMVILYETQEPGSNLWGDPDEAIARLPEDSDGLVVAFADGNVSLVPPDMTVQAMVQSWELGETCQRRVSVLCRGLLSYARDHEGMLPAADEWCDAIGLYVRPEDMGPEAFVCPGALDLDYGYAINADLAGKDIRQLRNHSRYCLILPAAEGVRNEARKVPEKVDMGRHTQRWGEGGLGVTVGLLSGSSTTLTEGQMYPKPPEQ